MKVIESGKSYVCTCDYRANNSIYVSKGQVVKVEYIQVFMGEGFAISQVAVEYLGFHKFISLDVFLATFVEQPI